MNVCNMGVYLIDLIAMPKSTKKTPICIVGQGAEISQS